MTYEIIYKGETVDTAETLKEAKYLQQEYRMAFNSPIQIKEA